MAMRSDSTFPRIPGAAACVASAALVCWLASAPLLADEIYRWVDENGVVNFTQLKPTDLETVEQITTAAGATRVVKDPPPAAEDPATEELTEAQRKMLDDLRGNEMARQEQLAQIREENCERSRSVLSRLTIKQRIRVKGEDGDYRVMGEDEREERIREAQENVAKSCSPA